MSAVETSERGFPHLPLVVAAAAAATAGAIDARLVEVPPPFTGPSTGSVSIAPRESTDFTVATSHWRAIHDPLATLDQKLEALGELRVANDPGLPSFIATQMHFSQINLNQRWRTELVHAAEGIGSSDANDRAALASGLLASAIILRDSPAPTRSTEGAMWAAVRALGGLMGIDKAGILLAFLRPEDRLQTRQVALQVLQALLARDGDAATQLPWNLRTRVVELAETYTNPDVLVSAENIALAANACAAALLAKGPDAERVKARVVKAGRPILGRQIELAMSRAHGRIAS